MPHSLRSHRLTEAYRSRLLGIERRVRATAASTWPQIGELDTTPWADAMAQVLTRAQVEGVRATAGYLGAFLRSETGRGGAPTIDAAKYAGLSRDGRPLTEALQSPLIGVKAALKEGRPPDQALRYGLARAERTVGFEAMQTPRDALIATVKADDRFTNVERAVAGTCAACMALSGVSGPHFEVHPSCECIPQPVVAGVPDRFPLPSGAALFAALTKREQDEKIGEEAADLVRDGAQLEDFVAHSHTDSDQPNWITQKPAQDVPATTN